MREYYLLLSININRYYLPVTFVFVNFLYNCTDKLQTSQIKFPTRICVSVRKFINLHTYILDNV